MKKKIGRLYGYHLHSDYRDASRSMRMEYMRIQMEYPLQASSTLLACLLYALATTKTKA